MSRENRKILFKKWNHSSRRKDSEGKREKRTKNRNVPRRKKWGAESESFDEFPLRFA